MCYNCNDITLRDSFYSLQDYLNCLEYIAELNSNGNYEIIEKTCSIDKVKNSNGCWVCDTISHVLECKKCGQKFKCFADTYHGGGSFNRI